MGFVVVIICGGIVLPVPVAANPEIPEVALAFHENVVPAGFAVKLTKVVDEPEQMVWFKTVLVITGAVLTVKLWVAVFEIPHSLVAVKETVYGPPVG